MKKIFLIYLFFITQVCFPQSDILLLYSSKNAKVVDFTWDSNSDQTFTGTIKGTSGAEINVDYGDGYNHTYVLSGTSTSISIDHTYAADGDKQIRITGDLAQITYVDLANQSALSGDISGLAYLTSLTDLRLYETNVSGDISAVSNLTSLTILLLYSTDISGDLSAVSNLTSLTNLRLSLTAISGDLSAVSNLTSLTILLLYSTLINSYTSTTLPAWSNCNIRVYNLDLTATEVDDFIIDLAAAGGTNGTLICPARTSASDGAVNTLEANGWTVTAN